MNRSPAVLAALASPIRQELASALAHGPTTVTDLAATLGRTRQALYYHMGYLVRAGLAKAGGWRGEGRAREQVYRVAVEQMAAAPRPGSSGDIALAAKAGAALLRLTSREFSAALQDQRLCREGPRREVFAMRGKARLTARELRRFNGLIADVHRLFARAKARGGPGKLYSVTVVLAPSRQAGRV